MASIQKNMFNVNDFIEKIKSLDWNYIRAQINDIIKTYKEKKDTLTPEEKKLMEEIISKSNNIRKKYQYLLLQNK